MRRWRATVVAWAALIGACDGDGGFSSAEWARLQALAWSAMPPPPADRSNAFGGDGATIALGQRFFPDARFSGPATQVDALRRPSAVARAPRGEPTGISCASCHDLAHAGADTTSVPGNVSAGAGWTDVNALGLENCAYQQLYGWNGRADSLWAQAFAVAESPTTMNGNRLHTAWVIADDWDLEYDVIFGAAGQPLPLARPSSAVAALLGPGPGDAGQCALDAAGACPAPCRTAPATPPAAGSGCWPRFPLDGKPGATAGC